MKSAFTHWANLEAARDEHHRGPLEIRQFSRILCNVDFLDWQVWHFEFEQESTDSRAIGVKQPIIQAAGSKAHYRPNSLLSSLPPRLIYSAGRTTDIEEPGTK